ncbi:MAG TPA: single-stranded-DNA-specific exonuclease RecJ [Solirubrobacteraceae bacterium]|nr:single-stranded-DNA-specific exonuclease RecJ [Solirubrobacteraceae bacterium]
MSESLQPAVRLEIPVVSMAVIETLERELRVSRVLAQVLARRGLADPAAAREFLDAAEAHRPSAFRGMAGAVELVLGHIARRSTITVHGDYDCDGVCSTAVLVSALRELGAEVDWHLPDRQGEGYGLAAETVQRLIDRGTGLLITADCAITAVAEVAQARAAGLDVLVTDHHSPREDGVLPDAPYVHPALCGYPFSELCATAVAAKLAQALRERAGLDPGERDAELELVAIATVADVVALRGENRRLVRAGLRALASTARPGLRALMSVAQVPPLQIDERALAFRLAPRINAAGRLYRADSALELLLTDDAERARELAAELDHANAERRQVETRIRFEAEAQVAASGPMAAYVLAATGWHPGVIGIVAARVAERHHRPAVLVALPELDGELAAGSGRSIPGFDLLGGLRAAGQHLERFGGHRAAAGLTLDPARLDAFRDAFVAHAGAALGPGEAIENERVDAIASGEDVGLALAEELTRLAPFGAANPAVSLLLPAATLTDPVGFGGEQRTNHARFTVNSGAARARAVRFGSGRGLPVEPGTPVDATFTLERNEWQGVVEPRLLLRTASPCSPLPIRVLGEAGTFLERVFAELDRPLSAPSPAPTQARAELDHRGRGIAALITQLLATGEPLLVLAADAVARRRHLAPRLGGFALASYAALARDNRLADPFAHVVLLDPPSGEIAEIRATSAEPGATAQRLYLAWGPAELRFAAHIHEREYGLRDSLAAGYRTLRARGGAAGRELEAILRGETSQSPSPEHAGRLLRVLTEVGLVSLDRERAAVTVTERRGVTLEDSAAYRDYQRIRQDGLRYLGLTTRQAA